MREKSAGDLVLAHHYVRPSITPRADVVGSTMELVQALREHPEARRIVVCGVRFIAETVACYVSDEQSVFVPSWEAGCPLADTAPLSTISELWDHLPEPETWVPLVYLKSHAVLKAFAADNGGCCCTTDNSVAILTTLLAEGRRVLLLPDRHLGGWAAARCGLHGDRVRTVGPGEVSHVNLTGAEKVLVWDGECIVHQPFTLDDVKRVRDVLPNARIAVHAKVPHAVAKAADIVGSAAVLADAVAATPSGETIVLGTEMSQIQRLAAAHGNRVRVKTLRPSVCAMMAKNSESALDELLETWPDANRVIVDARTAAGVRLAIDRMRAREKEGHEITSV